MKFLSEIEISGAHIMENTGSAIDRV